MYRAEHPMTIDFRVDECGSIWWFTPLTPAAMAFVADQVPLHSWQWLAGAFACEPRMGSDLTQAIVDEGLTIQ